MYEIDIPLCKLIQMRGERDAVRSYRLCLASIEEIEKTIEELGDPCRFVSCPCLRLARRQAHVADLVQELTARKRFGFDVELLTAAEIKHRFGFSSAGGLFSPDGAEIDPLRFSQSASSQANRRIAVRMSADMKFVLRGNSHLITV